jgi:hypothetical protein
MEMARFYLMSAHVFGAVRLKAGSTIADTVGNAQPGDKVVTTLSSATVTQSMKPLDAAATSMMNASAYSPSSVPCTITGAASIDA